MAQEPKPEPAPAPKPAAKPAPSATVAIRTPAKDMSGSYRIQISSLRSEKAVRDGWARLSKRHSDLLGDLSLNIERKDLGGGKGTYYRMQAGPLASRSAANSLCTRLKQRKLGCIVVRP